MIAQLLGSNPTIPVPPHRPAAAAAGGGGGNGAGVVPVSTVTTQWANGQRLSTTMAGPMPAAPPSPPTTAAAVANQLLGLAGARAAPSSSSPSSSSGRGGGAYCAKCGSARPDVRFPCCGFRAHARCFVGAGAGCSWPCLVCPGCGQQGGPAAGAALPVEVALPEPFRRNGEAVAVSPEELDKTRGGRWPDAEVRLAEMVMEQFGAGGLPLKEGARLGIFLCNLLQCSAARLSSKLRTGKVRFQECLVASIHNTHSLACPFLHTAHTPHTPHPAPHSATSNTGRPAPSASGRSGPCRSRRSSSCTTSRRRRRRWRPTRCSGSGGCSSWRSPRGRASPSPTCRRGRACCETSWGRRWRT